MTGRRVIRHGMAVLWRGHTWRIVAEVVAPEASVIVSAAGNTPGQQIPPDEWAAATYDGRAERWIVPGAAA